MAATLLGDLMVVEGAEFIKLLLQLMVKTYEDKTQ